MLANSNPFLEEAFLWGLAIAGAILLLLQVLRSIGLWMTLQKMGRHDFAALIPGYGYWELSRGAGFSAPIAALSVIVYGLACAGLVFILGTIQQALTAPGPLLSLYLSMLSGWDVFLGSVAIGAVEVVRNGLMSGDWLLVGSVAAIVLFLLLLICVYWGVVRSFDRGFLMVLGLLILPSIFFLVIGCSSRRPYRGPFFDRYHHSSIAMDWPALVKARMDTFGSNAPLALALIGMLLGASLAVIPSVILCIIALKRNGHEKGKPLAGPKRSVTTFVALFGIVLALGLGAAFYFLDGSSFVDSILSLIF